MWYHRHELIVLFGGLFVVNKVGGNNILQKHAELSFYYIII